MCALTAVLLLPVWGVAAVGHAAAGAVLGLAVRAALAVAVWGWPDLREEATVAAAPLGALFRVWRLLLAVAVLVPGVALRAAALALRRGPHLRAVADAARAARERLAARFPTACSLCADPRGLLCLSAVALAAYAAYVLYLVAFAADFGRVRDHRALHSPLSRVLAFARVYQPDESPWDSVSALDDHERHKSFLPSRATLLRRSQHVMIDSSLLATDNSAMPIFTLLDKEDEILREEGGDRWIKPREELMPLTDGLTEKKRAIDALLNWARPLEGPDADLTFEEFFETLEDDEFEYDPESRDWIFGEQRAVAPANDSKEPDENGAPAVELQPAVADGHRKRMEELAHRVMNANDESEFEISELEDLIREFGDIDVRDLAKDQALDPSLREEIINRHPVDDDESDESITVFV